MADQRRIPGLEGVRAIAASVIVLHHVRLYAAPVRLEGGTANMLLADLALGVTLFFALSAFLLYRPFAEAAIYRTDFPSLRRYALGRVLRIFPAYLVILAACLWVFGTAYVGPDERLSPTEFLAAVTLTYNLTPATFGVGLGPAWSLAVEFGFYVVLPLLGWVGFRLASVQPTLARRTMAALAPAAMMLVIGLSGRASAARLVPGEGRFVPSWHGVIVQSLWAQADLFAFGMVLAVVYLLVRRGDLRLPRWWRCAVIGAMLILAPPVVSLGGAGLDYTPRNTLAGAMAALFLALVVLPARRASWLLRLLEWRPIVLIGVASYSVFLWNEQVIRWLAETGVMRTGVPGYVVNVAITAVAVGLLATLTYRAVERPAMQWGAALRRRRSTAVQVETAP